MLRRDVRSAQTFRARQGGVRASARGVASAAAADHDDAVGRTQLRERLPLAAIGVQVGRREDCGASLDPSDLLFGNREEGESSMQQGRQRSALAQARE